MLNGPLMVECVVVKDWLRMGRSNYYQPIYDVLWDLLIMNGMLNGLIILTMVE